MSYAVVYSRAKLGVDAPLVRIEVHLSNGLPSFTIVGMAQTAVKESRDRVRSALMNNNYYLSSLLCNFEYNHFFE